MVTQHALVAYSIGLTGLILVKILAPGFYARQNVVTPLKIGVVTLVATQLMNLALVGPLGHAGLALAISLGACLNAGLLFRHLRRQRIYAPEPGWGVFTLKIALAVVLMTAALHLASGAGSWWGMAAWPWRVGRIAGLVALGLAVYGGALLAVGFRLKDFSRGSA